MILNFYQYFLLLYSRKNFIIELTVRMSFCNEKFFLQWIISWAKIFLRKSFSSVSSSKGNTKSENSVWIILSWWILIKVLGLHFVKSPFFNILSKINNDLQALSKISPGNKANTVSWEITCSRYSTRPLGAAISQSVARVKQSNPLAFWPSYPRRLVKYIWSGFQTPSLPPSFPNIWIRNAKDV